MVLKPAPGRRLASSSGKTLPNTNFVWHPLGVAATFPGRRLASSSWKTLPNKNFVWQTRVTRGCLAEPGKASRPAGPCQTKTLFGEVGSQNQENNEFHTPHVAHGMHRSHDRTLETSKKEGTGCQTKFLFGRARRVGMPSRALPNILLSKESAKQNLCLARFS